MSEPIKHPGPDSVMGNYITVNTFKTDLVEKSVDDIVSATADPGYINVGQIINTKTTQKSGYSKAGLRGLNSFEYVPPP